MADTAAREGFRRIFLQPGRHRRTLFSAFIFRYGARDTKGLTRRGYAANASCSLWKRSSRNSEPAAMLGAVWRSARVPVATLKITPIKTRGLGFGVEQLIAESTGKEGKGLIPVCWRNRPEQCPIMYRSTLRFD